MLKIVATESILMGIVLVVSSVTMAERVVKFIFLIREHGLDPVDDGPFGVEPSHSHAFLRLFLVRRHEWRICPFSELIVLRD